MIKIYGSKDGILVPVDDLKENTWICLFNPVEEELKYIETKLNIFPEFLKYPLDEEERPRIEKEGQQVLIILRVPDPISSSVYVKYETIPIGIILTPYHIITVCLKEHPIFDEFVSSVNNIDLSKPVTFLLYFFFHITTLYIKLLRYIDKIIEEHEERLFKALENEEFLKILNIEKSLTYFNTSLQGNDIVLIKLHSGKYLRFTEEEEELLEDVQIENKQAIEMTKVFIDILSNTMDAYASIINNNVNLIMKFLTSMAIILSIPTIIYSLYGMNIPLPFQELPPFKNTPYAFYIINLIIIIICASLFLIFRKKRYL